MKLIIKKVVETNLPERENDSEALQNKAFLNHDENQRVAKKIQRKKEQKKNKWYNKSYDSVFKNETRKGCFVFCKNRLKKTIIKKGHAF